MKLEKNKEREREEEGGSVLGEEEDVIGRMKLVAIGRLGRKIIRESERWDVRGGLGEKERVNNEDEGRVKD